jgi:hypothetical protein
MSTIVCLAEDGLAVVGTDSRFMEGDGVTIHSDELPKIFEIAPKMSFASSGWLSISDFQVVRARELAAEPGRADIRAIADALAAESMPLVTRLGTECSLLPEREDLRKVLSGEMRIHAFLIAGRGADGRIGYVVRECRMREGEVTIRSEEYFGGHGRDIYISTGNLAGKAGITQDRTIFTGRPVWVVRRILAALKRVSPTIGGADQILTIDRNEIKWINQLKET